MRKVISGCRKKQITTLLILSFILINGFIGYAQTWVHIYERTSNTWFYDFAETYDNGYILVCEAEPIQALPQFNSWLIKTDVNGNPLWTKSIASPEYFINLLGIDETTDGGIILTGATSRLDSLGGDDIVFIKLNACGEKVWCHIVSTPGNMDYGIKIKTIEGGYIALIGYYLDMSKRIWLFRLDNNGNIIWDKLINETTSNLQDADGRYLFIDNNNDYIITGDIYDSIKPNLFALRPLIIKTDSLGNDLWTVPWGHNLDFRGGLANATAENQNGFLYTAANHFRRDTVPLGDSPCFLKTSPSGQEMYYRDLIPDSKFGGASTLNLVCNDSLLISGGWSDFNSTIIKTGTMKCDTLGNVTKTKVFMENVYNGISGSLITFNNKYLVAGGMGLDTTPFHSKIYLFKLNMNLDYDSVYTVPRTYDSLCPHPVVSDTMSLDDCGVISDINEPINHPEKCRLQVFPNPADGQVTVKFPQYLQRYSSNGSTGVTTIYRQWKSTTLDVYDLNGKQFYRNEIPRSQSQIEMDLSSWPRGMYYFRLMYNGQVVAGEKVMVR